jgi:hypothetical protein
VDGKFLQHTGWRCINQGGGSMAGKKKRPMAWGMTYQQCQQDCIDSALDAGDDQAAAIYRNLPSPSEQEWALYLQEVAEEPSEDLSNPHHIMGRHELRLYKRGVPTVLGQHAALFASQIEESAQKVGFPNEFVLDALEHILDVAPHGQPRDKTRDN